MKTEIVNPNLKNHIKSLRDIGYTFEIAVADILDNSIAAKAKEIRIYALAEPELIFMMLDNGIGMDEIELVEAMRLATKDPDDIRDKNDLGRFGLGLKTASFSQCKKLTVISKKDNHINARQWDLDYLENQENWMLITPDINIFKENVLFKELLKQTNGTLIIWGNIDRYNKENFTFEIEKMRKHLALVFHRFIEGSIPTKSIKVYVNNKKLDAFNPFNIQHAATQEIPEEVLNFYNSTISITVKPFILPHHSKMSQQEYERYATEEGYTKSQGFYLYRANRLLIHGTWWGLHKITDAYKLVRIRIDISNDQDKLWCIDIKKSTAVPPSDIKVDLNRIISQVTERGTRPFTGRGRAIKDKTIKRFWQTIPLQDENFRFSLNKEHPLYIELINQIGHNDLLCAYLNGIEAYLPLDAIQAELHQNPNKIKQESALSEDEIKLLAEKLKLLNLDDAYIANLLKTEIFINKRELLTDGK
jgi:hypothetical protein